MQVETENKVQVQIDLEMMKEFDVTRIIILGCRL